MTLVLTLRIRNTVTQEVWGIGKFQPDTLPAQINVGDVFALKAIGNFQLELTREA